ncbi:ArnT family glycosyltransferase [Leptolyngbya sp. 7M]|uniref:ArnT family glycosyltransferase n=1 Tax=Leptolyngbya sp. 7M TaxID=2812896 RepID=UPI001B8BE67C|nr:phospholipid carrier-dependent glycosyltransferase [Leptolyngbya sp. 7M]QYO66083.1 glycosyltransferase family 39 protein [Leptolyngbya sp. 7M]
MSKGETNSVGTALPGLLIALWAVVLLVAFIANRSEDVGRIASLFPRLNGGPIFGYGIFDSLIGAVVAALVAASWFGLGGILTKFISVSRADDHSHVLEFAIKTAVGAAAWSLIWFVLGLLGLYGTASALISLLFGFVLTLIGLRRLREAKEESRVPVSASLFDKAILFLIAFPILLSFAASLAPPTAKDALLYHFALPKAFITQASNAFVEGNIASYLALGTEMQTVWAMLLGNIFSQRAGEAAGASVIWIFFPLLLATIFGFAREIGIDRRWALISVLMVATVPTAYHVASSAYIDVALGLFITLAIYSLTRWWKEPETGWLIFVAIFLGAALSAKLTTLFVIAAFALVILLRTRKAQNNDPDRSLKIAGYGFAALLAAGIVASPWYLRTWVKTGSPIFPFYMSIWPGKAVGWDVERSNLFQAMNSQYGGINKTPFDYVIAPWNLSVNAQPEIAIYFDGVLGVAFLIGLPVLLLALWKVDLPVEAKIGAGIAGIMFLFWLFSSQQLRYLLPILPILAISIAAAFQGLDSGKGTIRKVGSYAFVAAGLAALLTGAAWFLQKAPLRVILGGESRDQFLTRNIDYYPYYQWLNTETAPAAKVWLINMRRDTYNLDRPYFSDYLFEDWTLRQMVWESRSAEELKAKAAAMGVQYILTRHDFLFDYARSPLVDDQRPRTENEVKLRITKDLLLDPSQTIKADNRFSLVKVL